jgi:hypothetical protein
MEPPSAAIGALAEGQHGAVASWQLKDLGVSVKTADSRVRRGHWRRLHRGVYFVGHGPMTIRTRWTAAVLAYGPEARLSHRACAALHGVRRDNRARIDVSVPSKSVRQRRGIEAHAAASLNERDVTAIDGIPCTTLARTLIDLGEVVSRRAVELTIDAAERERKFDLGDMERALARAKSRRGAAVIRSILDGYHGPAERAPFAEAFLAMVARIGLPDPEAEALVMLEDGPIHVDFLWRDERIAVELDSRRFHDTTRGLDEDRDRDQQLLLAGFEPFRVTWRHLHAEAHRTERRLRRLYRLRRDAGRPWSAWKEAA